MDPALDRLVAILDAAAKDMKRDNDAAELNERLRQQSHGYWVTKKTAETLCDIIQHMSTPELLMLTGALSANDHCEIGKVVAEAWDRWEEK